MRGVRVTSGTMPPRRQFLRNTSMLAAGIALPRLRWRDTPASIVLRGAVVYDGTGAPGTRTDVVVEGGRITRVGPGAAAAQAIDLSGARPRSRVRRYPFPR